MAKKTKGLMLTQKDIQAAIEQSQYVKKEYPAFWKFYEMLLELNNGLAALESSMEDKNESKNCKKG